LIDRALAIEIEPSARRALLMCLSAWLALNQGDLGAAESAARECRRLAEQFSDPLSFAYGSLLLGRARLAQADLDSAEALFTQALETDGTGGLATVGALRGLAELATSRDDYDVATARFGESVAICEQAGEYSERSSALCSWAVLEIERGETAHATELAAESLRLRSAFPDRLGIAQCLEVLAWTAADDASFKRAATLLGMADAAWKAVGASLFADLAGLHDRCAGQARRALGERGFTKAVEQGAGLALTDALAYAVGERAADVSAKPTSGEVLTRREHQIAALVAEGLSNREIAARLVISQRTAEGHVENILAKLAFSSRSQIAAWVTERRHPVSD
jgi:non-specific serine/threonine protein kinase